MQYNLEEFNDYLKEYLGIKERIEETKNILDDLLHEDKLKKTLDFYNNLDKEGQKKFNEINCNMGFVRYKLNKKKIEELEKGLNKLYKDFIESEAFPFSKDEFHFFVSNDTYLVDAINGEDSSELSDEENVFLSDSISYVYKCVNYNPNDYCENDIPFIKVQYLENKGQYEKHAFPLKEYNLLLLEDIVVNVFAAKRNDEGLYSDDERECSSLKEWRIIHLKRKLLTQQQRILESDSKNKDLLLFFIDSAFYEIELLSGVRVNEIYDRLNNMEVINEHQRRKVEREKDALINAYHNLTNIEFRKNSGYYMGNHYMFARYETANPEINKRLLKMMKR